MRGQRQVGPSRRLVLRSLVNDLEDRVLAISFVGTEVLRGDDSILMCGSFLPSVCEEVALLVRRKNGLS